MNPTSTTLAAAAVATLRAHLTATLPWLSDVYGLVQTGTDKTGRNKYPQVYEGAANGLDVAGLYPDDTMSALCFFERDGPAAFEWTDGQSMAAQAEHALALVVWVNLQRIDPLRTEDFTDALAVDVLVRGLLRSPLGVYLTPGEVEQRAERVFARYNFPPERQQLLVYPYAGFRIPFTLKLPFMPACAVPFTPLGDGPVITNFVVTAGGITLPIPSPLITNLVVTAP